MASRGSDIEIFVCDCPVERLQTWVVSVLGPLLSVDEAGEAVIWGCRAGGVVVTQGMEDGPFTSLWFNSGDMPWSTDAECARQAAKELGCVVRCCPGKEFPEVPWWSDVFLQIADGDETVVRWNDELIEAERSRA